MPYLYILHSLKDRKWYIGCTHGDVHLRFNAHCKGNARSTKHRRPLQLAYYEFFEMHSGARRREWHLKKPKGYREKLLIVKRLLANLSAWPIEGPFTAK